MTTSKTALVTGANKGIGREITRRLAREGFTVWLGARDPALGEAAAAELREQGLDVRALTLDVTSEGSIAAAVARVTAEVGSLNVLVNNAGIVVGLGAPPSQEPLDDMRTVYEVNLFGPVRVTQAFLPLLKAAPAARIVMMSSGLGSLGGLTNPEYEFYPYNFLAYNSSKTALNAVTVAFAKELAPLGIKVNAADPGYTATDLNGNTGYRTVEEAARAPVRLALLDEDGPTAGFFDENGALAW